MQFFQLRQLVYGVYITVTAIQVLQLETILNALKRFYPEVASDVEIGQLGKHADHVDPGDIAFGSLDGLDGVPNLPDLAFLSYFAKVKFKLVKTLGHFVVVKQLILGFQRLSDHSLVYVLLRLLLRKNETWLYASSTALLPGAGEIVDSIFGSRLTNIMKVKYCKFLQLFNDISYFLFLLFMDFYSEKNVLLATLVLVRKQHFCRGRFIHASEQLQFGFFFVVFNGISSWRKQCMTFEVAILLFHFLNKLFCVPQFDMVLEKCFNVFIFSKILSQHLVNQLLVIFVGIGKRIC